MAELRRKEAGRLVLVNNERRKLMAAALDRLSTAFVVVGVLGQILSLSPDYASFARIATMVGWILGAVLLHYTAYRLLGGLKA